MSGPVKERVRVKAGSVRTTDSLHGLHNRLSGLGGARDKGAQGSWHFRPLDVRQLDSMYQSNWMAQKVVDIPVTDMLREGWTWEGDDQQVKALEKAQKKYRINDRLKQALTMARLYGGAALLLGDGRPADQPLIPEGVQKGGLKYVTPLSRLELLSNEIIHDPEDPCFGEPRSYSVGARGTATILTDVHPSRVLRFIGKAVPRSNVLIEDRWGNSILDAVEIAIRDATAGQQGIASLIQEASVDVFGIPGFMDNINNPEYLTAFQNRVSLGMATKSMINALLKDAEETYEQKTANFAQLPEVLRLLVQVVSGAADIPATRFLGQSPAGLSATGESDLRNYYDAISAQQTSTLEMPLQQLFDVMVRSELGEYPEGLDWSFNPLWQLSETERADVDKKRAETAEVYDRMGVFEQEAFARGVRGRVIEDGVFPGIDADDDFEAPEGPEDETDGEVVTGDAVPRTLYVRRQVKNAKTIIAWAKKQGFATTMDAADLHVTLAYSKTPVDWMKMGQPWEEQVEVPAGGPRVVEPLGDGGAIVLLFRSHSLEWRHETMKEAGAVWDYPEYQPHITITWDGDGVDLNKVTPYQGKIVLGPEIFEDINPDWRGTVEES